MIPKHRNQAHKCIFLFWFNVVSPVVGKNSWNRESLDLRRNSLIYCNAGLYNSQIKEGVPGNNISVYGHIKWCGVGMIERGFVVVLFEVRI